MLPDPSKASRQTMLYALKSSCFYRLLVEISQEPIEPISPLDHEQEAATSLKQFIITLD